MKLIFLFLTFFSSCSLFYTTLKPSFTPAPKLIENSDRLEFYWIGHATVLIHFYDKWIITDPNFSPRTGLIIKRFIEPGIDLTQLRKMDAILISHTHFDHLDQPSLRLLKGSTNIFAPEGGVTYIPNEFSQIHPVNNWKVFDLDGLKITAVPVKHFGGRWLIDNLWDGDPYTGYIIEYLGVTVFFGGDTGYDDFVFKDLGEKYKIDIALLPVGPASSLNNSGLGNAVHVNPFGAIQILKDTKSKFMIPIHHSTFYRRGGSEMEMLKQAIHKSGLKENIFLLRIGEKMEFQKNGGSLEKVK